MRPKWSRLPKEAFSERHAFKEALQTGDIEIELRIVRRKRSTEANPSYALDDIAAVLTDREDANYILDVPNVGKLKGTALSIQDDFTVPCPGGWHRLRTYSTRCTTGWKRSLSVIL